MGNSRRVFHDGALVKGIEHRADEDVLGAASYTAANVPLPLQPYRWFTTAIAEFSDGVGLIPLDALSVGNAAGPPSLRIIAIDPVVRDQRRQEHKDATLGEGGRMDALHARLNAGTITLTEMAELLTLRGF